MISVLPTLWSRVSIHKAVRAESVLRAPPVSWLTICPLAQPEKAIGYEPQIEPWLATDHHTACWHWKQKASSRSPMDLQKEKARASQHYVAGEKANIPA